MDCGAASEEGGALNGADALMAVAAALRNIL